jgi:hypothetical protein
MAIDTKGSGKGERCMYVSTYCVARIYTAGIALEDRTNVTLNAYCLTCISYAILQGHGTHTLKDGSRYVGEYRNGLRTGKGELTKPNGSKYVGDWVDDTMSGSGTH